MKRRFIWLIALAAFALSLTAHAGKDLRAFQTTYQCIGCHELRVFPIIFFNENVKKHPHAAIEMITAPYVSPPNTEGNNNMANRAQFAISCQKEDGKLVVTLDTRHMRELGVDYGEAQIFAGMLECLRRVMGKEIEKTTLRAHFNEQGQEKLQALWEKFLKHPKEKEFPHGWEVGRAQEEEQKP